MADPLAGVVVGSRYVNAGAVVVDAAAALTAGVDGVDVVEVAAGATVVIVPDALADPPDGVKVGRGVVAVSLRGFLPRLAPGYVLGGTTGTVVFGSSVGGIQWHWHSC